MQKVNFLASIFKFFIHSFLLTLTRSSRDTFRSCFTYGDCNMPSWFGLSISAFVWHSVNGTRATGIAQFIEQAVDRRTLDLIYNVPRQARTRCTVQRCVGVRLIDVYKDFQSQKVEQRVTYTKCQTHVFSRFHFRSVHCSGLAKANRVHLNFHLLLIHYRSCKVLSVVLTFSATSWKSARLMSDECY